MVLTRWYAAALLAGVLVLAGSPVRAQEDPAPVEPPETPPSPSSEAVSGKPPWWGGRNLLYVQIGFGQSAVDTIATSVTTENGNFSRNIYEIDDATAGRFALGWTLPDGRGRFLMSFEGIKEDGFKFDAIGEQASARGTNSSSAPISPVPWWYVNVANGQLSTRQTPPVWDATRRGPDCGIGCDRNDDARASLDELDYSLVEDQATIGAPKTLNNSVKTYDMLYSREFGGRRIWGDWSAGGRYFDYGGAVPMAAWLAISGGTPGAGYSDGVENRILTFLQETSGFGPTGSLGINVGFLRRKLVLHAGARVAFMLTSLQTNSGDFVTLYGDATQGFDTAPANLNRSIDKSTWHIHAQIDARWEVAPGFNLIVDYRHSGFHDVMVYPVALFIPDDIGQVSQGTLAVFRTQDFRAQTIMAGLSYQF